MALNPRLVPLDKQYRRYYITLQLKRETYYASAPHATSRARTLHKDRSETLYYSGLGWVTAALEEMKANIREKNPNPQATLNFFEIRTQYGDFAGSLEPGQVGLVDAKRDYVLLLDNPSDLELQKALRWLLVRGLIKGRFLKREDYQETIADAVAKDEPLALELMRRIREQTGHYIARKHFMKWSKVLDEDLLSWTIADRYREHCEKELLPHIYLIKKDAAVDCLEASPLDFPVVKAPKKRGRKPKPKPKKKPKTKRGRKKKEKH